ncbi:MAG TPA: hypothetical protein VF284_12590 [Rhodanobacteraceae bacterium]
MKKYAGLLAAAMGLVVLSGCTVNLPFNTRPSFNTVTQARGLDAKSVGPVKVELMSNLVYAGSGSDLVG